MNYATPCLIKALTRSANEKNTRKKEQPDKTLIAQNSFTLNIQQVGLFPNKTR